MTGIGNAITAVPLVYASVLGASLRERFSRDAIKSDVAGNIGFVSLHLRPNRRAKKSSSRLPLLLATSVFLAEGSRLVFDDTNWKQPALTVIQLDPKLRTETSAVFEVRSGNIPLSWTITFFVLTGLFLLFGLWHKFILLHPASDKPGDAHNIPAFIKEFFKTFGSFFRKPKIVALLLFLLLYRFGGRNW
ncbi:MAG: hypothetical protein U1F83_11755 [Verrucomicrobiota bacterium]